MTPGEETKKVWSDRDAMAESLIEHGYKWKSIIIWPETVSTGNTPNETVDWHYTRAAAVHVCRMIEREGMGLLGVVFPVSTRVEEATHEQV